MSEPEVSCPCCDHAIPASGYVEKYTADFNKIEYKRYKCLDCDVSFWWPLKIDNRFYTEAALDCYSESHSGERGRTRWSDPFFSESWAGGDLLDVGCGNGSFIKEASRLGFRGQGIDLDCESVKWARQELGLQDVECKTLEEYMDTTGSNRTFDVVTSFEVLEHQDDPKAFVIKISKLLKQGGKYVGTVPNRERFLVSLERRISKDDFPPHHFLWFSRASLRNLFRRAGYNLIKVAPEGRLTPGEVYTRLFRIVTRLPFWKSAGSIGGVLSRFTAHITATFAVLPVWMGHCLRPTNLYFHVERPAQTQIKKDQD